MKSKLIAFTLLSIIACVGVSCADEKTTAKNRQKDGAAKGLQNNIDAGDATPQETVGSDDRNTASSEDKTILPPAESVIQIPPGTAGGQTGGATSGGVSDGGTAGSGTSGGGGAVGGNAGGEVGGGINAACKFNIRVENQTYIPPSPNQHGEITAYMRAEGLAPDELSLTVKNVLLSVDHSIKSIDIKKRENEINGCGVIKWVLTLIIRHVPEVTIYTRQLYDITIQDSAGNDSINSLKNFSMSMKVYGPGQENALATQTLHGKNGHKHATPQGPFP